MAVSCLISVKIRLSHLTWTAAIGQKTKEHQCLEIALESDWKCTTVGGPLWRGLSCCGRTACDGTTSSRFSAARRHGRSQRAHSKAGRRCCDEIGDPKASKEGTRDGGNLCGTARAYYKRGGIAPGASIK